MAFKRHLFIDRLSQESEDQQVRTCSWNQLRSFQNSAWKFYAPMLIGSSNQSPLRHDNYSDWLIFYYRPRHRLEGKSLGQIFIHDRCSPIMKCAYIALLILKEILHSPILSIQSNICMAGKITYLWK